MLAIFLGAWKIVLILAWPAAWGFGFALWEKLRLAPNRNVDAGFPAICSGLVPAAFAWIVACISLWEGKMPAAVEAAFAGIAFMVICGIPAMVAFYFFRRLLRTRFKTKSDESASSTHPLNPRLHR